MKDDRSAFLCWDQTGQVAYINLPEIDRVSDTSQIRRFASRQVINNPDPVTVSDEGFGKM